MGRPHQKRRMGSQAQLADKLGVTPQMLSAWKLGRKNLSSDTALRWADILNIDIKKLISSKARDRPKLLGLK